jgi:ABC-type multidrug transport system ATPase subunit
MNSLTVDSVQKYFYLNQVLTDIFVKINEGEIIGLVGRNGSGKSTLLKIIFGSLPADNKYIKINGALYSKPYLEDGLVTYLPQADFLPKFLKVSSAVKLFLRDSKLAEEVLSDDIISKISGHRIRKLSGGEKRYLEVQMILHKKSDFTLLDEPFNGIAPIHIEQVKEKILACKTERQGIIITDHDYRNVLDQCDRIILLFDGGTKHITNKSELADYGYLTQKKLNQ